MERQRKLLSIRPQPFLPPEIVAAWRKQFEEMQARAKRERELKALMPEPEPKPVRRIGFKMEPEY